MRQATSCAQVSFAILISQNTMFKWLIKTPPFSAAPICFSSSRIMWRRGCQFYSTLLNNSPAFLMLRHTNKVTWTVALSYSLSYSPLIYAMAGLCMQGSYLEMPFPSVSHFFLNQSTVLKCSSHSCYHNIHFSVTVINGDKK